MVHCLDSESKQISYQLEILKDFFEKMSFPLIGTIGTNKPIVLSQMAKNICAAILHVNVIGTKRK